MEELLTNWETVANTLRDGLLVIDKQGIILGINSATVKLTGFKKEELIGKSCQTLKCTGCKLVGKGSGEQWCKLFSVGECKEKKCQFTSKTGKIIQIIKSASVLKDTDGNAIGAVETLTDLSVIERQHQEIMNLRQTFLPEEGFCGILGKSAIMQKLFALIDNVANSEAPVMIHGQSGTGKELVARAIHESSPRRDKPFIKVNCAALNENLLESELFGHVKGAFTGAEQTRIGRFEAANGGTIFLDEVGDIPLATQVKLLRVLEEKEVERVGDHTPIMVDVRIVTATNRNLESLIQEGLFRKDFFFRINVFPLYCPTLGDRRDDIPIIIHQFIVNNNKADKGKTISGVTPDAMEKLLRYPWPGNIRELRNAVDYAFVLCPGGEIETHHLPPNIIEEIHASTLPNQENDRVLNREKLLRTLRMTGGNQSEAAKILGVSRVTVWKWIKKFNIDLTRDLALSELEQKQTGETVE
ncbi:sigma-54 interaction domain-containing protein [Thermodesulfobacteriota bacterium]